MWSITIFIFIVRIRIGLSRLVITVCSMSKHSTNRKYISFDIFWTNKKKRKCRCIVWAQLVHASMLLPGSHVWNSLSYYFCDPKPNKNTSVSYSASSNSDERNFIQNKPIILCIHVANSNIRPLERLWYCINAIKNNMKYLKPTTLQTCLRVYGIIIFNLRKFICIVAV